MIEVVAYDPTLLQSASSMHNSGGTPSGSLAPSYGYDEEDEEDWEDEAPRRGRRGF
ncbi:MAG: hypothetical protein K5672_01770 [Bacteroidaceae bacterium]|nr:hypothetical protein [Bacteroidaceae bacterium]